MKWLLASVPVARPLIAGFRLMQQHTWAEPSVERRLEPEKLAHLDDRAALREFSSALETLTEAYASLRVFWKDRRSVYLGGTPRFARDAGVSLDDLVGIQDTDPRMIFSRQGPKYQRDDRRVMDDGEGQGPCSEP